MIDWVDRRNICSYVVMVLVHMEYAHHVHGNERLKLLHQCNLCSYDRYMVSKVYLWEWCQGLGDELCSKLLLGTMAYSTRCSFKEIISFSGCRCYSIVSLNLTFLGLCPSRTIYEEIVQRVSKKIWPAISCNRSLAWPGFVSQFIIAIFC